MTHNLFPAVPGKGGVMNRIWIRDNYYVYVSAHPNTKFEIFKGFEQIVKKYEPYIKAATEVPPKEDHQHIHPVYTRELEQISEWGFVQNDAVGNLLEVMSYHNLDYAKLIYDYLIAIKFWECPDFGFWEEKKEIHPSSIASCLRGIYAYGNSMGATFICDIANEAMLTALPRTDLATLSLLYPKQLVDEGVKRRILSDVWELEGKWGVKRYRGDKWNGESRTEPTEPEWPLGFCFLYEITGDKQYLQQLERIKAKFGYIPELMINGRPGCNTPLTWAEAMFRKISPNYNEF